MDARLHCGTTLLAKRILQRIAKQSLDSLSFADFMEMALYEQELGYYSDPRRKVGRVGGDFYTSVSVGPVFGQLLASAAESCWRELGRPAIFYVVEQGAHDGQLAVDFLRGAGRNGDKEGFSAALRYVVIEPRVAHRAMLHDRFAGTAAGAATTGGNVEVWSGPKETGEAGIFLCNELVDAFPVVLVRWRAESWWELRVVADAAAESGFGWREDEISAGSELAGEVARVDTEHFSEGYTTEINLAARDWLRSVAGLFASGQGRWWLIDYGHREEEYFAPHRHEGTLRCYREHQAGDDPLAGVGATDITAHVNFDRVQEWAMEAGLSCPDGLVDQHDFLTRAAVDWLREVERGVGDTGLSAEDQAKVRQFQTLTHPGMMGRVFKVLTLLN